MRRYLTMLLLGAAAIPAAVQAQEDNRRSGWEARAEARAAARAERTQSPRQDRPQFQRAERPQAEQRADTPRPQFQRQERAQRFNTPAVRVDNGVAAPAQRQVQAQAPDQARREWRGNRGAGDGNRAIRMWNGVQGNDRRDNDRRDWNSNNDNRRRDWNSNDNRRRDWNRNNGNWNNNNSWNRNDSRRWSRNWRSDNRYDWQRYRSSNRQAYRLPRYYAPYGWDYGYRRFSVGVSLFAGLYAQDYWINDPWSYRLPPTQWPYRWVRYYDDALLVDVRYGEVVDVIEGIFW